MDTATDRFQFDHVAGRKPGILEEVERNEENLAQFKEDLSRYVRGKFTDPASLRPLVSEALAVWRLRHHPATATADREDPDSYLKALEDDTRRIRITRGLQGTSTTCHKPGQTQI